MAYGGLRGAVGFSLVLGIDKQQVKGRNSSQSTYIYRVQSSVWRLPIPNY
jgi:hypothetical protein